MLTIHKYELPLGDYPVVNMPEGAEVLHIDTQGDWHRIFIWARVDTDRELVPVRFRLAGTGHQLDGRIWHRHLGTVLTEEPGSDRGALVLHLFALGPEPPVLSV